MELPIFSDNLRSSAAWSVNLEREREAWRQVRESSRTGSSFETQLRTLQTQETLRRASLMVNEQCVDELTAENLQKVACLISNWAAEPEAALGVERLTTLYRALTGINSETEIFRQAEGQPLGRAHQPAPAIILPRLLEQACSWFTAPSFAEIHPVEQAALVYLRLLDLQPFATHHEPTALLAASFYTERAGWPPLIIFADEATIARHTAALDAAFRMLTQPLVEFFAESLARTIKHFTESKR